MDLNGITYKIIGAAYKVHSALGAGLLERIYEEAMIIQLAEEGLKVESQVLLPVYYRGRKLNSEFRLDLLVEDEVIVELKSVSEVTDLFSKQLLTYLKIADKPLGLLINFNVKSLDEGITRIGNFY
ncbi:MAG: GxxExxY protein [Muribaculaceae bacterium]|nr:GxxExxY protein [Muribaculaceae bacterium]